MCQINVSYFFMCYKRLINISFVCQAGSPSTCTHACIHALIKHARHHMLNNMHTHRDHNLHIHSQCEPKATQSNGALFVFNITESPSVTQIE